jgi:deoxyribodipyrimidine photo-lyase
MFTRDLRLQDNTTLQYALKHNDHVIPIFIYNPIQIDKSYNKFYNAHCINFMNECLHDLNRQLRKHGSKLYALYGETHKIIKKLIHKLPITSIYLNEDVTIYSRKRLKDIRQVSGDIPVITQSDLFLLQTPLNKTYFMFTSYYNKVINNDIKKSQVNKRHNYYTKHISGTIKIQSTIDNVLKGGRKEALKRLFAVNLDYNSNVQNMTSNLSPYLKFGCISSREIFNYIRKTYKHKLDETFLRQLIWRDFYYQAYLARPEIFNMISNNVRWNHNTRDLNKWKNGKTGCSIVDAAMHELITTGMLHNRLRLVVATYLVKILKINWKFGELVFARYLLDYDPILNNSNWIWLVGIFPGSHQPVYIIMNMMIQSKKFDPYCVYIKKWCPELHDKSNKEIHEMCIYN